MDWDNVRVFLAVARAGQFVAAARRLKLDHATVSRRIAALEAALGAKLFDRRTTGAKLTSAGEWFIAAAEQIKIGARGYVARSASNLRMTSGSRSIANNNARAGASGVLRRCSQSRKVVMGR